MVESVVVLAGWYQDPEGKHEYRYWDGRAWTDNVADAGQSVVAPLASPGQVAPPVVVPATTLVFGEAAGGDVKGAPFDIRTLDGASYGRARSPQQSAFSGNMSLKTIVTEVRDPAGTLLFTHSDPGGLGNKPDVVSEAKGRELGRLQVHVGFDSVGVDVFAGAQLVASVKSRGMLLAEFGGCDVAGVDVVRYTTRLRDDADFSGRADRWWVETLVQLPRRDADDATFRPTATLAPARPALGSTFRGEAVRPRHLEQRLLQPAQLRARQPRRTPRPTFRAQRSSTTRLPLPIPRDALDASPPAGA